MHKKQKTPFIGLTLYMNPTGATLPKYEFKAKGNSMWFCSLTRRKYRGAETWESSPEILNYIKQGYSGNWYGKHQQIENPKGYEKGDYQFIITYILTKGGELKKNIDGFKPIGQAMPQYREMPMTEAQPSAPEYAKSVEKIEDMDDDLPPF